MTKTTKYIRIFIIAFSFFAASFSLYIWQIFRTPNLQADKTESFTLKIPSDHANFETVWDSLQKHNVVKDVVSFRFLVKMLKYEKNVKPGRYVIHKDMGNYEAIKMLKEGDQTPVKLTFNNVRLKKDLIHKIGTKFEFDSLRFSALIDSAQICQKYNFNTETIMCMFLPNTYEVYWDIQPEKLLERMKYEYEKFWTNERKSKAAQLGMSPTEVQILASIVEEETKKTDEKPKVAGLYLNRLKINMPLQADPTVKFALKDFAIKRILNAQLQIDSPYNTYKNTGLPPGPIRLADLSSVDAVLNYQKHNFTYMCASPELNGYHIFAENYPDHLKNAALYQTELNKLGIKK